MFSRQSLRRAFKPGQVKQSLDVDFFTAVRENKTEKMQELYDKGACPNAVIGGWRPIHWAANCGSADAYLLLQKLRANFNAKTDDGYNVYSLAVLAIDRYKEKQDIDRESGKKSSIEKEEEPSYVVGARRIIELEAQRRGIAHSSSLIFEQ